MRSREIAARYAGALYEAAAEEGTVDEIVDELARVVEQIYSIEGFDRFLLHPLIDRGQKLELVRRAFPDLSLFIANLVELLIRNRREGYLELIHDALLEVRSSAEDLARVRVTTARPLAEGERADLSARLEKGLGRAVLLEEDVDEGLWAGARIEVEGQTIDATLRAKVHELRTALGR